MNFRKNLYVHVHVTFLYKYVYKDKFTNFIYFALNRFSFSYIHLYRYTLEIWLSVIFLVLLFFLTWSVKCMYIKSALTNTTYEFLFIFRTIQIVLLIYTYTTQLVWPFRFLWLYYFRIVFSSQFFIYLFNFVSV